SLHIETDPPGATVYVDGRARGAAPLAVEAEAGRSFAVRAVKSGFHETEQLVTAAAGDSPVRLHLDELAASLTIATLPAGVAVELDGKELGRVTPLTLPVKPHQSLKLRLHKYGFEDAAAVVDAPGGGESTTFQTVLKMTVDAALLTVTTT